MTSRLKCCLAISANTRLLQQEQEAQLLLWKTERTAYVRSPASDFQSRKESDLSEMKQFHARFVNGTLFRKLQWTTQWTTSHVVISPSDINSYRVNEQGKYQTQVLQTFLTIKTPCSWRHATAYTVPVAVLTFRVIQGHDFHLICQGVCHFLLVINSNLGRISHRFQDMATYSLKLSTENCGQTAANRHIVTIDSL